MDSSQGFLAPGQESQVAQLQAQGLQVSSADFVFFVI